MFQLSWHERAKAANRRCGYSRLRPFDMHLRVYEGMKLGDRITPDAYRFPEFREAAILRNNGPPDVTNNPNEEAIRAWRLPEYVTRTNNDAVRNDADAQLNMNKQVVYVTERPELFLLINDLQHSFEFAVDFQFSRDRGYFGHFPCIMQISTQKNSYIINVLNAWKDVGLLKPFFEDPQKLKIFHDAKHHLCILQKFFGVFTVAHIDLQIIHNVRRGHNKSKKTLEELIKIYITQKDIPQTDEYKYMILQAADWSVRPLESPRTDYARRASQSTRLIWVNMKRRMRLWVSEKIEAIVPQIEKKLRLQASALFQAKHVRPTDNQLRQIKIKKNQYALLDIYKWRAELAKEIDVAPPSVVNDEDAMGMAKYLVTPEHFPVPHHQWFHNCTDARKIHDLQLILASYLNDTYNPPTKPIFRVQLRQCGDNEVGDVSSDIRLGLSNSIDDDSQGEGIDVNNGTRERKEQEINPDNRTAEANKPADSEPMHIDMATKGPDPKIVCTLKDLEVKGKTLTIPRMCSVDAENDCKGLKVYDHSIPEGMMSDVLCICYLPKHVNEDVQEKCKVVGLKGAARKAYLSRVRLIKARDPDHKSKIAKAKKLHRRENQNAKTAAIGAVPSGMP